MGTDSKKGRFTFRFAAVLLAISAALELLGVASEALLFGEVRHGVAAGIYHLLYAALFVALAWGLWKAAKWGYTLIFVAAGVYTLDKMQFVLYPAAMEAFITTQMAGMESELQAQGIDASMLAQTMTLMAFVAIACWWGFALYAYWRRDYFSPVG